MKKGTSEKQMEEEGFPGKRGGQEGRSGNKDRRREHINNRAILGKYF